VGAVQEGEQFRVLDPPSLPVKPSFPNTLYFAGGGLGGGAALGLAILYLFMMMDKTLNTEADVEMFLKVPVLVSLPVLQVSGVNRGSKEILKPSAVARN